MDVSTLKEWGFDNLVGYLKETYDSIICIIWFVLIVGSEFVWLIFRLGPNSYTF